LHPLPKLIEKPARAFPRLQFVTRFAGPNLMMRALRAGTFDLVFCNHQLTTPQDEFIRVKVFEDHYIVVARPDHPALKAAPLSAGEFMRLPLASAGLTPDFRSWLGVTSDRHKQNLEAFLSDDYDLIKRIALETDHVARGPRFVFEPEVKSWRWIRIFNTSAGCSPPARDGARRSSRRSRGFRRSREGGAAQQKRPGLSTRPLTKTKFYHVDLTRRD
jgi:DNA-binding transcriptional LysR family regulator